MSAIVLNDGAEWELPNILDAEGQILHRADFYQMMILWALPLAMEGHRAGMRARRFYWPHS